MVNVPGAIYRSAWHAGYAIELISDEIEHISGYPPGSFLASAKRTLLSLVHRDDRGRCGRRSSRRAAEAPYSLEYPIVRADGAIRWVLDRGQPVPGPGGRLWLDGALFDVTERRAAEEALLRREIEAARSAELHASRARIIAAADAARRKIERDLHDGAQRRLVTMSLDLGLARRPVDNDAAAAGRFLDRLAIELPRRSPSCRAGPRHPPRGAQRARLAPPVAALATRARPVESSRCRDPAPLTAAATAYFTVSGR